MEITPTEIYLQRPKRGDWVDLLTLKPTVGRKVVVLNQDGDINIASMSNSGTFYDWQMEFEYEYITHWMPGEEIEEPWPENV